MYTALWQRWCCYSADKWLRWDSSGSDSKCRDNDVPISVTAMITGHCCDSAVRCHYFHSDVHIAVIPMWKALSVSPLSVVTTTSLVCTVMLENFHYRRCCSVVSLHRWHTNVATIAVTVLFGPLLSDRKTKFTAVTILSLPPSDVTLVAVSVDSSVNLNHRSGIPAACSMSLLCR